MSDDLRDLLNNLYDDLSGPTRPADAVKQSVLDRHAAKVRNRRVRSVVLASVICVVALGGLVAVTRAGDGEQSVIRTGRPSQLTTEPQSLEESSPATLESPETIAVAPVPVDHGPSPWLLTLPDPPLEDRSVELVVPMGDSMFVWGGFVPNHQDGSEPPFSDGAIADLEDGTWRPVAEAPLASGSASGVWTGSEVVVSNAGLIAAYDPAVDSWRLLTLKADLPAETQHLALLGNEVLLPFAGWAWNFDDDTWRQTAVAPALISEPRMDVVGGDLIVTGDPVSAPTATMALRYDADADVWVELPPPGSQVYQGDATGVVGNDVVLVSWWSMRAQALDLDTLQWRDLPTFPQFNVKCLGHLEPAASSIVVVSMCGQHAALDLGANRWIAFDPPTTSGTFSLHRVDRGLLIDGAVLETASMKWIESPQLGPVSTGGATISRDVRPELRRSAAPDTLGIDDDATITVKMASIDCVLEVGQGDLVEQLTVSAARQDSRASPSPVSVGFLNQFGSYLLACPSAASYSAAFDALTVRGERLEPQDALALFNPPLAATESPEKMADAVAEFIEVRDERLGREPSVLLSAPTGDPVTFLIDSYYDDGATGGETYTITLAETEGGWVIEAATVQLICTQGPAGTAPDQTCS